MAAIKQDAADKKLTRRVERGFTEIMGQFPIPTPSVRAFTIFTVIFAILAGLFLAYLPSYREFLLEEERAKVERQVSPYGQALSSTIAEKAGIVYGVTAFAKAHPDIASSDPMFIHFASNLLPRDKSIVTIGISPGGVIANIYPASPTSIGLDLKNDKRPDVRRDVAKTIAMRRAMIAGPVLHSLHNQIVMVIRDPIFNADGSFWGITNVAFEKEMLISSSGIDELAKTLDFGIKELNGDHLDMDKTVFRKDPVIVKVSVPGTTWLIGAVPKNGWAAAVGAVYWPVLFGGLGLIFVLATLITGVVDRQNALARAVAKRTSELKDANEALSRLNRLYAVLTGVNKAIVMISDTQALFEEVCRTTIEKGGFRMCWIGLVDEADQTVRAVATAGYFAGYLDGITISTKDVPEGRGSTGAAIRENRPVYSTDIANDPNIKPRRERALERGYRASGAFPIKLKGVPIGALTVYDANPRAFLAGEKALLEEIAIDVSFALDKAAQERDLEHAATFPRNNPNPIVEFSVAGVLLFFNEAATNTLKATGLDEQYDKFQPADFKSIADSYRKNPSSAIQNRDVDLGDRVFGEVINFVLDSDAIRIYAMDITDKKIYETELNERQEQLVESYKDLDRMLTMYSVLSETNEKMLRITDRKRLSQAVCESLVGLVGYDLGALILRDKKDGIMKTYAQAGKAASFVVFLDDYLRNMTAADPIFGELIERRKNSLCVDMTETNIGTRWREEAAKAGLVIFGAFPIVVGKKTIGAIMTFSGDPGL